MARAARRRIGSNLIDALEMHTMGGAYQMHRDDRTGSIDVGKDADIIVLDQNLLEIPVQDISATRVLLTMARGVITHEDPATSFSAEGARIDAAVPAFPDQPGGSTGPVRTVTVTAKGDRPLRIGAVSVQPGDAGSDGEFLVTGDSCAGQSLATGESCAVKVRFAPARPDATSTASLVLEANVAGNAHRIPLTARSTALDASRPQGSAGPAGPAGPKGDRGRRGRTGATSVKVSCRLIRQRTAIRCKVTTARPLGPRDRPGASREPDGQAHGARRRDGDGLRREADGARRACPRDGPLRRGARHRDDRGGRLPRAQPEGLSPATAGGGREPTAGGVRLLLDERPLEHRQSTRLLSSCS